MPVTLEPLAPFKDRLLDGTGAGQSPIRARVRSGGKPCRAVARRSLRAATLNIGHGRIRQSPTRADLAPFPSTSSLPIAGSLGLTLSASTLPTTRAAVARSNLFSALLSSWENSTARFTAKVRALSRPTSPLGPPLGRPRHVLSPGDPQRSAARHRLGWRSAPADNLEARRHAVPEAHQQGGAIPL